MTIRTRLDHLEAAIASWPPHTPMDASELAERWRELIARVADNCRREGLTVPNFAALTDSELAKLAGDPAHNGRVVGRTPAQVGVSLVARLILAASRRRLRRVD